MSQTRNSSRSRTRQDYDGYGRDIGPSGSRASGDNGRKTDAAGRTLDPEDDDDFWIHRDKLARIESEELQQAAMRIQRQVRASSKSSTARARSHDSQSINGTTAPNEQIEPWPAVKRHQLDSPIPLEDEPQTPTDAERMNWDLRRPEEIAAEASAADADSTKMYKSPGLKKSTSRIPVLTTSPHPISAEQVDRELPSIQRARTRTLGSGDDESTSNPKTNNVTTQVDNREASSDSSTPPASSSRPGSRGASSQLQNQPSPAKRPAARSVSSTTGRKASGPSNTRKTTTSQNARSVSATDKRPQTRSGDHRPTTSANSPEGDPPWLATMYKPDPRLPPEQQILPTHAKRMQQEQWEREGKTPSTYDRDFSPLAVRPDEPPRNSTTSEREKENTTTTSPPEEKKEETPKEDSTAWPLKSPKSPEPPRPGTSGTNYSTMPKVQNTPPVVLTTAAAQSSPSSPKAPAAAEPDDKVGKGCGCCIVM